MAIRNLTVRAALDAAGITRGMQQMAREMAAARDRIRQDFGRQSILPDMAAQGRRAAEQLASGLQATFQRRANATREALAAGLINEEQAAKQGRAAAESLNRGLIAGMSELRRRGLLTPEIQQQLAAQMIEGGRALGRQTAEGVAEGIAARGVIAEALGDQIENGLKLAGESVQKFGRRMQQAGRSLSLYVTAPITAMGVASAKMAIDFEDSFAGIRKTMELTEREFERLAAANRQMATEIPVSVNELNRIGELAGQLGIEGVDNVLKFERTIAQLAVTTDLTADSAALSFAQMANVMQLPQDQIDRLGAAVVGLGNNFATVESTMVEFAQRIAGAGQIVGLTAGEVVGIGTAFASLGVNAEAGGTAVQKVLISMMTAVAEGDERLAHFADTAGRTTDEFARLFQADAAGAFVEFVAGLSRQGEQAVNTLNALGLTDQRLVRSFLAAAGAGDLLARAVKQGNEEFAANTALTKEAEQRFRTVASQLQVLKNRIQEVGISIGEQLTPAISEAAGQVGVIAERVRELDPATVRLGISIGAVVATLGPLVTGAGLLTVGLGALATTLGVGLLPLIAVGGPVIVALGAMASRWIENQLEALEAAAAVREYIREIEGISERGNLAELLGSRREMESRIALIETATEKIEELKTALPWDMFATGLTGQAGGGDVRAQIEVLEDLIAKSPDLETLREKLAEVNAQIDALVDAPAGYGGDGGVAGAIEATATAAEEAAEALEKQRKAVADEVSLLQRAQRLHVLRAEDIGRAYEIERDLRQELERGNVSLERRVAIQQQLSQLPSFDPGAAQLAVPEVDVIIGGVNLGNAEEVRRRWKELVQEELEEDSVRANLNLELIPTVTIREHLDDKHGAQLLKDIEAFNEAMQAVREVTGGIRDLADALDELSPALAEALRGVDTMIQGMARFRESQNQTGALALAGQVSGVLSIASGVVGIVSGIRNAAEQARKAERELRSAMDDWADALVPKTALEEAKARIQSEFEGLVKAATEAFGISTSPDFDPANIDRAQLEALAGMDAGKLDDWARAILTLLDTYDDWIEKVKEENELRRQAIAEDLEVRALAAQGLDEEAAARRIEIQNRREIQALIDDGYAAEAAWLEEIHEMEAKLREEERQRRAEEAAEAEAAAEAARQFAIAMTDMEISARRAALAGDELAAMQIRGEAAIMEQIAAWEKLEGSITTEQIATLADLLRDELADAIDAAAKAAERARASFETRLAADLLRMEGDEIGARRILLTDQRLQRIEEAEQLFADTPDKLADVIDDINRLYDGMIAGLVETTIDAAREAGRMRDPARDEIIRRTAGISETTALSLQDIGMSQLGVLQEIAFNTSVLRAGDGVTNFGTPVPTGPTIEHQTIHDTGTDIHVHVTVQGHVLSTREGTREIAYELGEGIDQALGGRRARSKRRTGDAHR